MELTQTKRKILKYVFITLAIILFTGPVLICVGIALMVVPTERTDRIDEYNSALGSYNTADIDGWAGGTVNTVPLTNSSRSVQIFGEQDDITYYSAKVVSAEVPSASNYQFNIPAADLAFNRTVPASKTRSSLAVCTNGNGCSVAAMQTYCVNEFGAGSTFTGPSDCKSAGFCYECTHTVFLTELCAVLRQNTSTTYIEDPEHASCFFPFTADSHRYESLTAGTVLVTLRKSNDPFMALQRLTQGRMDFGSKVIHERMAGYGLLVAGVIMTCLLAFMIYMLLSTFDDIKEEEQEAEARRIKVEKPASPDSQ